MNPLHPSPSFTNSRKVQRDLGELLLGKLRFSGVVCLLALRCPAAVTWLVTGIVIDAVYRMIWGTAAHIRKEVLVVAPSFTDLNSAATVVLPIDHAGVLASPKHGRPNGIFRGSSANNTGFPVFTVSLSGLPCRLQTATASSVARLKGLAIYDALGSALAATQPRRHWSRVFLASKPYYLEASKCLSC